MRLSLGSSKTNQRPPGPEDSDDGGTEEDSDAEGRQPWPRVERGAEKGQEGGQKSHAESRRDEGVDNLYRLLVAVPR